MRTFAQYLVLGTALMLLLFGAGGMRKKPPVEIPAPITETTVAPRQDPRPPLPEPSSEPETPVRKLADLVCADDMNAAYVFAYDVTGGEMVLCSSAQTAQLYPASITKLFTAWVALRMLYPDDVVTAGWELGMLQPGSSQAFIALDSRLTVEMLIEGMLLPSGNDAALVLAAAAGRVVLDKPNATASEAVAEFVKEMNRAALALDLQNSHFVTPDGYHDPEHYSCPADLARIATLALEDPVIRRCMGLQKDTVTFVSGQTHRWENTNRLLNPDSECYCPEALGMKTGYTGSAGYCLLAAFGETRPLVVGIFGSEDPVERYRCAEAVYNAWVELSE